MNDALVPTSGSLDDFADALQQNPELEKAVAQRTKARAKAYFHGRVMERLISIADGEDDKTALTAINLICKLAGELKAPKPVVLSFDELVARSQAVEAGPLTGITQIQAPVIDADDDGDDTTE